MQDTLKIAFIQSDLVWENPKQNRKNFKEKIEAITTDVDMILLPEMFTTGFTMNARECAETMDGKTVSWMQKMAVLKNAVLVGSIIIEENYKFYNRLLLVHPDGKTEFYDKRHTFTLAGEHEVYASGNSNVHVSAFPVRTAWAMLLPVT